MDGWRRYYKYSNGGPGETESLRKSAKSIGLSPKMAVVVISRVVRKDDRHPVRGSQGDGNGETVKKQVK